MDPPQYSHLNKNLASIIREYAAVNAMRPDVAELAKLPEYLALLMGVFENHIALVTTRSQAFEDGQITLYDRALLILTSNGKNMHNLGAIELFLDEILGVKKNSNAEDVAQIIQKNIALRSIVSQVMHPQEEHVSEQHGKEQNGQTNINIKKDTEQREPPTAVEDSDPRIARMLKTFSKAKSEFHSIRNSDKGSKYLAAKFLRDTAENTLTYFRDMGIHDHEMIPHIKAAYWLGHNKTLEDTGRARPFEMGTEDYGIRARRLRDSRLNAGRSGCYRPGTRGYSYSSGKSRSRYPRHA
ncbi:hypothetical protein LOZ57_002015 [Ophidiomyces ophidiicola]|uniref:uncharacterized protein n=1 Tax=Ophidiomyces ophidiicola TaxID=1387563 RepID=UPI0020C5855B|nr:uncharacterized protein LOZ57_002015 [Ophidiomyces ophidiicola]KAI1950456.1 hypothetical protein LOZ57_002015 [Ophidiomyces ophidiicola]KAI2053277.1 hypothetical protein LOZ43_004290 [Ophidiomyces ophidiicola]